MGVIAVKVQKRDGRVVSFNYYRIQSAISKAFKEVYADKDCSMTVKAISKAVVARLMCGKHDNNIVNIEDIQDCVENTIMEYDKKVAKAYITYRYNRQLKRDRYTDLMSAVNEKISAINVQNQNANVDEYSFGGRVGETSDYLLKQYALDYCMSKMARENHINNHIYIHDLSAYTVGMHNCLSIPFDDLLANGFTTRQVDIRPAQSVNTAFQLVAVIFQIQSLQQFGGVSATHLDWTMIPYVRKSFYKHYADGADYIGNKDSRWIQEYVYDIINDPDCFKDYLSIDSEWWKKEKEIYRYAYDMTVKEIYQAVEGMYHNLNSLQSRSGNQLPFSSINYGTCTLEEGRLVTKALLDVSIKGVGKLHKTSVFPCGIFQCMEGVNRKEGDPNYDLFRLALKSTAKRLYPNYANCNWSGNTGYDKSDPRTFFSTMGCRTANGWDINGFGQLKDGRGNICPVTIIMPTLAMEVKEALTGQSENLIESFFEYLSEKIDESKDMLIERFNWICSQNPKSASFMWENNTMAGYVPEEGIRSALKHGTLAIGQIGLAETLQILIGTDHTTKEGMELAKRIENLFKVKCAEFKEKYKLNFGVYFSPAENLCYTSMKKFKKRFGIIPNISDREYFTNSMHVPVWKELTPFEKIDIESQLTGYSSAGCITYVELPESAQNNIDALETIVNYAMDKDIPYFAINVPNDVCDECGYTAEMNDICPKCGSTKIKRLRRVTGYLTGNYKTAFNKGKQQETEHRVKHIK